MDSTSTEDERNYAIRLLHQLAERSAQQIEAVHAGDLAVFEVVNGEKDALILALAHITQRLQDIPNSSDDTKEEIRDALNTYMVLEAGVQKALSERAGSIADKLIGHYRTRLGQEGYNKVANLFTPVSRLFPDSTRYIDERR